MERLIEQPADEGDVFEASVRLGRVHYHLSVYQHFSQADGAPAPGYLGVEGRIIPKDRLDLVELHRRRAQLTLHLADGRRLEFSIADGEGTIRSSGRGLL